MLDQEQRSYLFVTIRPGHVLGVRADQKHKTTASARAFLNALYKACPIEISKERTDRLFASRHESLIGCVRSLVSSIV